MSKIHFQIGTANYVQISLPSKMEGDGDTFVGKAKIHVSTVSCSQNIKIHKSALTLFFSQVEKAYETLKGAFTLESGYGTFALRGEISRKGHVRIMVKIGYPVTNHPDYTEWQVEAAFSCDPYVLKQIVEARRAT